MRAKVLKLSEKLFDGEVVKIIVPSKEGEMCLLPNHMSIMTPLREGMIKIFRPGIERPISIPVNAGLCSFFDNTAIFIL